LLAGFASLPVFSTRFAAMMGTPARWLRMSVSPFDKVADAGVDTSSGRAGPAFGISNRQGSSALIASPPPPACACAAAVGCGAAGAVVAGG
jgi:hypothetical protein